MDHTENFYYIMNRELRTRKPEVALMFGPALTHMIRGLEKLDTAENIVCFRGLSLSEQDRAGTSQAVSRRV